MGQGQQDRTIDTFKVTDTAELWLLVRRETARFTNTGRYQWKVELH